MLTLCLKKRAAARIRGGHPWIFRDDIALTSELELAPPGSLARVVDPQSRALGIATFSPSSTLAARLLSRNPHQAIDLPFFRRRVEKALAQRERHFGEPFYRLIYADSDGFPGLVVDRFGPYLACRVTTAGMWRLLPLWRAALLAVLAPKGLVIDHSDPLLAGEGVPSGLAIEGEVPDTVPVHEGARRYVADLRHGQKTGWFFDQRANHDYVQGVAAGARVLDLYCHAGGFGIAAAVGGAHEVAMVDSSELALSLACASAAASGVGERCRGMRAEVFADLEARRAAGESYDLVIADPPAFIKTRAHVGQGLKGYAKLAHLAAGITARGGLLCLASCSHHAGPAAFRRACEKGLKASGRAFTLAHHAGAARDHPVHPKLPESRYLTFLVYRLDGVGMC